MFVIYGGSVVFFIVGLFYWSISAPYYTDKLQIAHSKTTNLGQKVIDSVSNLKYHPCFASTDAFWHVVLMVLSEIRMKVFRDLVPSSREILRLTDGGSIAIEWAYHRPQKTQHMTAEFKNTLRKMGKGKSDPDLLPQGPREIEYARAVRELRPLLIIFLGIASTHTESCVQNSCKDAWAAGY